jgi:hypothetical protein
VGEEPRQSKKEIVMSILFFSKKKKYKWVLPTGKVVNPCRDIRTWIAEKTFTDYFCISTGRVSLCWVKRKSPPNRLLKVNLEKEVSLFRQSMMLPVPIASFII